MAFIAADFKYTWWMTSDLAPEDQKFVNGVVSHLFVVIFRHMLIFFLFLQMNFTNVLPSESSAFSVFVLLSTRQFFNSTM